MAVRNDYLRVGVVPAESHLELEKEARDSFFGKSRVNARYRVVTATANDAKHLLTATRGSRSTPRGHDGRHHHNVQKVREFGESTSRSGVVRRARYG